MALPRRCLWPSTQASPSRISSRNREVGAVASTTGGVSVCLSLRNSRALQRKLSESIMTASDPPSRPTITPAIGGPTTPAPESMTMRRLFATARRGPRSSSGKYDWVATSKMSVAVPMIKSVR